MKNIKRLTSLLLISCMVLGLAACGGSGTPAAEDTSAKETAVEETVNEETAEDEIPSETDEAATAEEAPAEEAAAGTDRSIEFPGSGITLNLPQEFENTHGVVVPYGGFDITEGSGIYQTALLYYALTQEEYDRFMNDPDLSEEDSEKFWNSSVWLLMIVSADNGMTFDDVSELDDSIDPSDAQLICKAEDCTHYLYETGETLPEGTDAVFLEEFETLKGTADKIIEASEFGNPKDPMEDMIGRKLQFETTDTEGNSVKSEDLFASHEITMVNIWASWCGYCIDEMEELEAINERLAEKDCTVVGLLSDGNEEEPLASGKETLKEKGVTYINILPPENLDDIFYIEAYPTTYFVNREGVIIGTPIVGAKIDSYEPMVEALLTGDDSAVNALLEEPSVEEEQDESQLAARIDTNEDSLYRVIVLDEDKNPVPEVKVQFCSDNSCKVGETDETGTAVFREEQGHYTAHIVEAPDEYVVDGAEYTLEAFADLTIYLYKE